MCKDMTLPVLYGFETQCLVLREENTLWRFEKNIRRRKFGHKREEVIGERRKLHDGALHNRILQTLLGKDGEFAIYIYI